MSQERLMMPTVMALRTTLKKLKLSLIDSESQSSEKLAVISITQSTEIFLDTPDMERIPNQSKLIQMVQLK